MSSNIEFLSAVLLISPNVIRLAEFYRDSLGFPLKEEKHGETEVHYGCELGDVHFAIHPMENFEGGSETRPGSVRLAFVVFDMAEFMTRMKQASVTLLYEPRDVGFSIMTSLHDPDGNYLEFTELTDRWYEHLESRRKNGNDILLKWRTQKGRN